MNDLGIDQLSMASTFAMIHFHTFIRNHITQKIICKEMTLLQASKQSLLPHDLDNFEILHMFLHKECYQSKQ